MLDAVPEGMRGARFVSAVCAVLVNDGRVIEASGSVEGTIARDLRGDGGFGYDPLFRPTDAPGRRMAELTADGKHAISHRGRAMRALLETLERL
jgi:XTP/dITP diphosphohydrolase